MSGSCAISCNDGTNLHTVDSFKYLGVWLDSNLSFKSHIDHILHKVNFGLSTLYCSRHCFTLNVRKKLAIQLLFPLLDYCDVVYLNAPKFDLAPLNTAYNRICRFVLGCAFHTHHCALYQNLNLPSPDARRHMHWLEFIYKSFNLNYPPYLKQYLSRFISTHQVRHTSQLFFTIPHVKKAIHKRAFKFKAPADWNNLPANIRSLSTLSLFKRALSSHFKVECSCMT